MRRRAEVGGSNLTGLCLGFRTRQPWFLVGYLEAVSMSYHQEILLYHHSRRRYMYMYVGDFIVWNILFFFAVLSTN